MDVVTNVDTLFCTETARIKSSPITRILCDIADAASFDFVYVPTVSRPTQRDLDDHGKGTGRANNVLRHVLMKEEETLQDAKARKGDLARVVDEGRLIGQKQPSSDSVDLPGGLGESAQVRIGLARREMLPLLHLVPDVVTIRSQLDVGH